MTKADESTLSPLTEHYFSYVNITVSQKCKQIRAYHGVVWTGFIWFRIGSSGGLLWTRLQKMIDYQLLETAVPCC